MEEQRERSNRRRSRRKSKAPRNKAVVEPVLIAARRPDSPLLKNGSHGVVASAQPKQSGRGVQVLRRIDPAEELRSTNGHAANGHSPNGHSMNGHASNGHSGAVNGSGAALNGGANGTFGHVEGGQLEAAKSEQSESQQRENARRRAVRIVKVAPPVLTPGNREQQLLDRLVRSEGRLAISRAADDLWDSKIVPPKRQEVQIQLLEHENEQRARDAVFAMAELLQREAPIKRPVLDQRLRRLEQFAEDPITRDAAGALRRSMRVHHGGL